MAKEPKRIKDDILLRVRVLYLLFVLIGVLVFVRLLCVQFFSTEIRVNAEKLDKKIFTEQVIHAHRGTIFSRTGDPLATSIFRYTVLFDFGCEGFDNEESFREQADSLSKLLAAFFKDKSAKEYRERMLSERAEHFKVRYIKDTVVPRSEGWFDRVVDRLRGEEFKTVKLYDTMRNHTPVRIFRDVDYNEWQTLKTYPVLNWNLGVVYDIDKHDDRAFPHHDLARYTVGRRNESGKAYGIESLFDEQLRGRDGVELRQRIAPGFWGRVDSKINTDPEDGMDVVTTLDIDIQEVADRALREQLAKQNALWGTTLVMEAATGDILAMVNLSRNAKGEYVENFNHALMSRAEPGSTFKLAAMLALVDEAGMDMSRTYDSGSGKSVNVGAAKVPVRDSHDAGGVIDLKTAVAESANVYFAKAVYETYASDPDRYVEYLRHLHLDRKVCVGFSDMGEAVPRFPYRGSSIWYPHVTLVKLGYGYGIEVTPIHMLTLYNAVANNGRMVAPRLVSELRKDDRMVETFDTEVLVDKICSDKSLKIVRECLEETARSGTAKEYFGDKVPFGVGAKTGTAQFAQGGIKYGDGYYLGSMATYFPSDEPRYTIYTSVYTRYGRGTTFYGAGLAGPVNRKVATFVYNREHDWCGHVTRTSAERYPVAVKGGNIVQTRKIADKFSPRTSFDRRRGWGTARVDSVSTVIISSISDGMQMPDVKGVGLKDALFILENRGLSVTFSGKGAVCSQSIRAGEPVRRGTAVHITLK